MLEFVLVIRFDDWIPILGEVEHSFDTEDKSWNSKAFFIDAFKFDFSFAEPFVDVDVHDGSDFDTLHLITLFVWELQFVF